MEKAKRNLVVCLGEILYDLLSDNPGLTIDQVHSWTSYMGGAPANVAFALSKLKLPVAFIGRVGKDPEGKDLVNSLEKENIQLEGIQWDPSAPTRKVYVERNLEGDRKFAGFGKFKTEEFADTFLESSLLPLDLIQNSEYLVLGTLLMAYPKSLESLEKAIEIGIESGITLIMDVNWRPVFWDNEKRGIEHILRHIQKMQVVKFSKEEAELIYQTTDLTLLSTYLPETQVILITDGDQGCHYKIGEHLGFIPSFKVNTIDTTGAGDSFLAGFIYQMTLNKDISLISKEKAREMVIFASAMGAITTTGGGAILPQPYLIEVEQFLENQSL